ncbi:MAG: cAMP-binding domain of or a regulatory subunit of cAMP-dependent protein kinase [Mucilaginibacter sp.]|nr:cAMP-binding domain of or a regulatory subunit of cAMP-dependent protein kinase [Mucilaginibacter sp.]
METIGLLNTLNSITILSESLQEQIKSYLVEERFTKKSILLKEGQVSQRIYFIKRGFIRAYYHKGSGEFTSWFMGEGDIIVSVYSFFHEIHLLKILKYLKIAYCNPLTGTNYRIFINVIRSLTKPDG